MIAFCGQDNCIVDGNGRIRLTQRVVEDFLREGGGDVVMFGLPEGAVALYPESVWRKMRASSLNSPEEIGRSFALRSALRRSGALTRPETISRQGRITLPAEFLKHAALACGAEAAVVGVEIGVEIWSAERLQEELLAVEEHDKLKRERDMNRDLEN